jgi:hypothetical protein
MPEDTIYQDDWTQRLKETPPDPLEDIRQEHEGFLSELESLAVEAICASQQRFAIAINDWSEVYDHINFNAPQLEVSTKSLTRSGADSLQTTELNERKD